jgi:nicotinamide riboside transporter PnuC
MNWTWLITIASIIGTVANIKKQRWCFYIWVATNALWAIVNLIIGLYSAAFLFTVYTGLAIWGIISWRRQSGTE